MLLKKTWHVIACCIVTIMTSTCMEEQTKKNIEEKNKTYLDYCGNEDAPESIQNINNDIVALYKAKGYLNKNTVILVKNMSKTIIEAIKNDGGTTWNNMITNRENLIHIAPEHDALTDEEIRIKLAHEQAHVAIQQKAFLNPHYYLKNIHFFVITPYLACTPCIFSLSLALAAKSKRPMKTLFGINGASAAVIKTNAYLDKHLIENYDLPTTSPNFIEYSFLNKLVEIECDMIAATAMKDGGRHGENVYRKHLIHNGNTNGINGDHPYTSTRVWYHHGIKVWQDYFKHKEKPEIK